MLRLLIFMLAAIASGHLLADSKPPLRVVTTIKPLTMIARDIGGDRIDLLQLVSAGSSPHSYAMKTSHRRAIQKADILLWVGDSMDGFVGKVTTGKQVSIASEQLEGIRWPTKAAASNGCESEPTQKSGSDPHIWLNPCNAGVIAKALAVRLAQLDPDNGPYFLQAAERFQAQLEQFDQRARQQLSHLHGRFVVQHDAYGHFINRYGLGQLGSLRSGSGAKAGARTMATLLSSEDQYGEIACLLTDPQFDPKDADTFSARTGIQQIDLDPLGHQVTAAVGESHYLAFLNGFVDAFQQCLAE